MAYDSELVEVFLAWKDTNEDFLRYLERHRGELGTLGRLLRTFQETAEIVVANELWKT